MLWVRIKVTEEHNIIVVLKRILKGKRVVNANFFFWFFFIFIAIINHIQLHDYLNLKNTYIFIWNISGISFVFKITDIKTSSVPSNLLCIVFLFRKHAYLHPIIIERVNFEQVNDWNLDSHSLFSAHNREVKPLTVILAISVSIQINYIFKLRLSDCLFKISTLKLGVK